jgi:hypothetical protein
MAASGPDSEDPRAVALDMTERKFVIVKDVMNGFPARNPTDARVANVMDPSLGTVVDQCGHIGESEVLGQEIVIIWVAVGVNIGLDVRDDISIFR